MESASRLKTAMMAPISGHTTRREMTYRWSDEEQQNDEGNFQTRVLWDGSLCR